jgi:uncharacterized protein (DUF1778 family)
MTEVFLLDEEAWDKFQAALDAPARVLPRLRELFSRPTIFSED